jgi:hypothetical protein
MGRWGGELYRDWFQRRWIKINGRVVEAVSSGIATLIAGQQ